MAADSVGSHGSLNEFKWSRRPGHCLLVVDNMTRHFSIIVCKLQHEIDQQQTKHSLHPIKHHNVINLHSLLSPETVLSCAVSLLNGLTPYLLVINFPIRALFVDTTEWVFFEVSHLSQNQLRMNIHEEIPGTEMVSERMIRHLFDWMGEREREKCFI